MDKPKVYGYARASTAEQESTLLVQQEAIEREYRYRFTASHDWAGCVVESGVSGSVPLAQRPKGLLLCASLQRGDILIVTKLDRGFRNLHDLAGTIRLWQEQGIRLVLLDLNVDTGSAVGAMLVHILGAVAEFERQRIAERTREVMAHRRAEGKCYCGKPPYGYKIVGPEGKRKLVPDPFTRRIGALIVAWIDEGYTQENVYWHFVRHRVKTRLGKEWSLSTIQRAYNGEKALQAREQELAEEKKKLKEKNGQGKTRPSNSGPTE